MSACWLVETPVAIVTSTKLAIVPAATRVSMC